VCLTRYEGVGAVQVKFHAFITLATGCEWPALHPCRFITGERASDTHLTGGWVGPREGLNAGERRHLLILERIKLRVHSCQL
jgi:hypothetical protein